MKDLLVFLAGCAFGCLANALVSSLPDEDEGDDEDDDGPGPSNTATLGGEA